MESITQKNPFLTVVIGDFNAKSSKWWIDDKTTQEGLIIYDKAFNESFHAKLESLQYNATLAITGAIRGSSTEKIYEELGLESLKSRSWYWKMSFFYKVFKSESPSSLFNTIPNSNNRQHQTRN